MRKSIIVLVCFLFGACSKVAPTNPYDPQTPESSQEKASVSGSLWDVLGHCAVQGSTVRLVSDTDQFEASSGADGTFTLSQVPKGTYTLTVESDGYRDKNVGQVIVRIGADVQVGEIELTYETAELSGTVRLDDDLCPDEDTEVLVTATPTGRVGCGVREDADSDDESESTPTGLQGISQVVTIPGRPEGGSCGTTVGYSFGQVRLTNWNVSASADGYQRRTESSMAGSSVPTLDLPIDPGTLNGRIELSERLSIETGFCLGEQAFPIRYAEAEDAVVYADCEEGSFSIPNLRQGEYTLRVNHNVDQGITEYTHQVQTESVTAGVVRDIGTLRLTLVRGAVTVQVDRIDLDGENVGGLDNATVTLRKNTPEQVIACANGTPPDNPDEGYDDIARDRFQFTTGGSGLALFNEIVGGSYTVHIRKGTAYTPADNCVDIAFEQGGNNETNLTFDLDQTLSEEPGGFTGTVTFEGLSPGETGPIAEVIVNNSAQHTVRTDPNTGAFSVANLPEGAHDLSITPVSPWDGTHASSTATVQVTGGLLDRQVGEVAHLQWRRGHFAGTITLEDGGDPSGASIIVRHRNATNPITGAIYTASAVANANGTWRLDDLYVGDYEVDVSHGDSYVASMHSDTGEYFTVVDGQDTPVVTRLEVDRGCLSGQIQRDDGVNAYDGVEIALVSTGQATVADDQGGFSFNELSPGQYTVRARLDGYGSVDALTTVHPGQSCEDATITVLTLTDEVAPEHTVINLVAPTFQPIPGFPSAPAFIKPVRVENGNRYIIGLQLDTSEHDPFRDHNFDPAATPALGEWHVTIHDGINAIELSVPHGVMDRDWPANNCMNNGNEELIADCIRAGMVRGNYVFEMVAGYHPDGGPRVDILSADVPLNIVIAAVDAAGNRSESAPLSLTIDGLPPATPGLTVPDAHECAEEGVLQHCYLSSDSLTLGVNNEHNLNERNFGCLYLLEQPLFDPDNPEDEQDVPSFADLSANSCWRDGSECTRPYNTDVCHPVNTQSVRATPPADGGRTLYCLIAVDQSGQDSDPECIVVTRDTIDPLDFDLFPTHVDVRGHTAMIRLGELQDADGQTAGPLVLDQNFSHFELKYDRPGAQYERQDCGDRPCENFMVNVESGEWNSIFVRAVDRAGNVSEPVVVQLNEASNRGVGMDAGTPADGAHINGSQILWTTRSECDFDGDGTDHYRGCDHDVYFLDRSLENAQPLIVPMDDPITTCLVACENQNGSELVDKTTERPPVALGSTGLLYADYTEDCVPIENADQLEDAPCRTSKTHRVYFQAFGADGTPGTEDDPPPEELGSEWAEGSTVYSMLVSEKTIAYARYIPPERGQPNVDGTHMVFRHTLSLVEGMFSVSEAETLEATGDVKDLRITQDTLYWVADGVQAWKRDHTHDLEMRIIEPGPTAQSAILPPNGVYTVSVNNGVWGIRSLVSNPLPEPIDKILMPREEGGQWRDGVCACGDSACALASERDLDGAPNLRHLCIPYRREGTVTNFGCDETNAPWCGEVMDMTSDGLNLAWVTRRFDEDQVAEYALWAARINGIEFGKLLNPNLVARGSGRISDPMLFIDSMIYLDHTSGRARLRRAQPGRQDWLGVQMNSVAEKAWPKASDTLVMYAHSSNARGALEMDLAFHATQSAAGSQAPVYLDQVMDFEALGILPGSEQDDWQRGFGYALQTRADALGGHNRTILALAARTDGRLSCGDRSAVYRIIRAQIEGASSEAIARGLAEARTHDICLEGDHGDVIGIRLGIEAEFGMIYYSLVTRSNQGGGVQFLRFGANDRVTVVDLDVGEDNAHAQKDCHRLAVHYNASQADGQGRTHVLCTGFTEPCNDPNNASCWRDQFTTLHVIRYPNEEGQCTLNAPGPDQNNCTPNPVERRFDGALRCVQSIPLRETVESFGLGEMIGLVNDIAVSDGRRGIAVEVKNDGIRHIVLIAPNSKQNYTRCENEVGEVDAPEATRVYTRFGDDLGGLSLSRFFLTFADTSRTGQAEVMRVRVADEVVERVTFNDAIQHHPILDSNGSIFYFDHRYTETAQGETIHAPGLTRRYTLGPATEYASCETHAHCAFAQQFCDMQLGRCAPPCANDSDCRDDHSVCGVPMGVGCGNADGRRMCGVPPVVHLSCDREDPSPNDPQEPEDPRPPVDAPCQVDAECNDGAFCHPNTRRCAPSCDDDADCAANELCGIPSVLTCEEAGIRRMCLRVQMGQRCEP